MNTTGAFGPGHVQTFIHKNSRSLPVALIYLFRLRKSVTSEERKLFGREILFPYLNPIDADCASSSDALEQCLVLIVVFRSETPSIRDITENRCARQSIGREHGEFRVADGSDQRPKKYPALLSR